MNEHLHQNKVFEKVTYSQKEIKNREFESCTFQQCDLSESNFIGCRFIDCTFSSCNLTMLKLNRCTMSNALFRDSKILGVNFSNCEDSLFSVRFEGCVADYASFMNKKMAKTVFRQTSLKQVNFANAVLTQAVFDGCDLYDATFNRTQLNEADFRTARNYIIDPENNPVRKAKFSAYGLVGLLTKYNLHIE